MPHLLNHFICYFDPLYFVGRGHQPPYCEDTQVLRGIRVVLAVGHFGRVVSAKFCGDSAASRFGHGSFRPSGGYLNFSAYIGLDPASTAYPIKISGISGIPK